MRVRRMPQLQVSVGVAQHLMRKLRFCPLDSSIPSLQIVGQLALLYRGKPKCTFNEATNVIPSELPREVRTVWGRCDRVSIVRQARHWEGEGNITCPCRSKCAQNPAKKIQFQTWRKKLTIHRARHRTLVEVDFVFWRGLNWGGSTCFISNHRLD
jgi:hypothetical protein